jgi:hypothetical protein
MSKPINAAGTIPKYEGRIAATDVSRIKEDAPELVVRGHLFHQRSGISNGNKALAGILFALAHLVVPVFIEDERSVVVLTWTR